MTQLAISPPDTKHGFVFPLDTIFFTMMPQGEDGGGLGLVRTAQCMNNTQHACHVLDTVHPGC